MTCPCVVDSVRQLLLQTAETQSMPWKTMAAPMGQRTRSSALLLSLAALTAAALTACGGGGGGGGGGQGASDNLAAATSAQTTASTPASAVTVKVASVQFAQSMLYDSTNPELVLVSGKSALLKVNATAAAAVTTPEAGTVHVESADGTSKDIMLNAPRVQVPTVTPEVPSFDDAYTATLPAELVKSGMKLTIHVPGADTTAVTPRVGGAVAMRFVPIAVKIGNVSGQPPSDLAQHLTAMLPVPGVTVPTHAVYVSGKVTSVPEDEDTWGEVMSTILGELSDLRTIEGAGAHDHYMGFVPKHTVGWLGMGYMPGRTAVSADLPNFPVIVRQTVVHELGHNLSLRHADCGNADDPDPNFPYPDAQLGIPGHYVWPYLDYLQSFHDPRPQDEHDVMSYCDGDFFSDYDYRKMQVYLTPADKTASAASTTIAAAKASAAEAAVQEVLLVSGRIRGESVELNPVKALQGRPAIESGPYTLRVTTATGVTDYAFSTQALDHRQGLQHFSVVIPNPGTVTGMAVWRDGKVLVQAASKATTGQGKTSTPSSTSGTVAGLQSVLQLSETDGTLLLRWDAANMPFLTVTWTDGSRRVNLAQDLHGGEVRLSTAQLPAGGKFEMVLSDGLNSRRVESKR